MPFPFLHREPKHPKKCTKGCPDCPQNKNHADVGADNARTESLLSRISFEKQERLRKHLADAFAVQVLFDGDEWDGRL